MNKKLVVIVSLICTFFTATCFAGLHDYPNLAVLNFRNKAVISNDVNLDNANMLIDFVENYLLDTNRFNILERDELKEILDEHSLQMTGLTDPATNSKIGKLSGAEYLMVGSLTGLTTKTNVVRYDNNRVGGVGNVQYVVTANITARIIEVATGRIVLAGVGKGSSTSTRTEFSIGRTDRTHINNSSYVSPSGHHFASRTTISVDPHQTIKIGSVEVSQVQVQNAMAKAAKDLVFGKFGLVNKMDGKGINSKQ